ncbi:hypothetical protein V8G61_04580 [Gaetbulibacter sp. M240]|uniref:hypothetical protein n=1 Tax=Gaetbulibacter sp. M240 TaxID=3126511 RepID=UPI00374E5FFB
MNRTILIIFVFFSTNLFSQELTEKVGEIEVQLIYHYFKRDSDSKPTQKKTNRKNRPHEILYFDSNGTLLKKIGYGKQHNSDLKLIDYIEIYSYDDNKLTRSIKYESDYQKHIYPYLKTEFIYNEKGQLIDDSIFLYHTGSLFQKTTYEYDLNSNKTKSMFNSTYFYQREFDSINRLTSLKQIYDSKLRWEWNYTYSDNQRIGIFQTHYDDGKDYSQKEIQTFNEIGFLIETEVKHISKSELNQKVKFFYSKNGIISKIEQYETSGIDDVYEFVSFTQIEVNSKSKINSIIAEKINDEIGTE